MRRIVVTFTEGPLKGRTVSVALNDSGRAPNLTEADGLGIPAGASYRPSGRRKSLGKAHNPDDWPGQELTGTQTYKYVKAKG